ncbi:hypothetical protein ROHU_003658 [Labeo rohita]|uniref:Uncharacterized protein n=1 Tax=Labeo rohita TaxID=84645 RepID=A0A498NVZ9_LABRO|nr:hypothetical protein ROHU_031519 [Labeo rohita]RXN09206.1 hypothetical protein ROHU_031520 [Labeo rohita]RXN35627.1 hypothetical protein ROHU_003658 [Labeo rohita]
MLHRKGEPSPMLDEPKRFGTSGGGTLTVTKGSFGSAAPEARVPLATMYRAWSPHCNRREPWLCCTGKESPVRH